VLYLATTDKSLSRTLIDLHHAGPEVDCIALLQTMAGTSLMGGSNCEAPSLSYCRNRCQVIRSFKSVYTKAFNCAHSQLSLTNVKSHWQYTLHLLPIFACNARWGTSLPT
jgi:hypothetical protein